MTIDSRSWDAYIRDLRKVNDEAANWVRQYLETRGIPTDRDEINALIEYANAVCAKFSEASATIAAEMYDALAALSGVAIPPALPAPVPEIGEVAKTIVGTIKTGNDEIIAGAISRLVKRTGVDTTMQNALRDGAEWAWIPHGMTCAFCITLASRGWQKASRKALKGGHAEHIHANCDCSYAIRFDPFTDVEGYDPDKYLEMYNDADGSKPKDKINSMRRDFYEKNKEDINEQKRSNYEERRERESSAAEETEA